MILSIRYLDGAQQESLISAPYGVSPRLAFIGTRGSKNGLTHFFDPQLGCPKKLGAIWDGQASFFLGCQLGSIMSGALVHFHVIFLSLSSRVFTHIAQTYLCCSCHPRGQKQELQGLTHPRTRNPRMSFLSLFLVCLFVVKARQEAVQFHGEGKFNGSSSKFTFQKGQGF